MASKEWYFRQPDRTTCEDIARELDVSPLTARLLANRGISEVRAAREFLHPSKEMLHRPFEFREMGSAVETILNCLSDRKKIVIFGDYDADGICATAVMVWLFRLLGVKVEPVLPDRRDTGYDLQPEMARRIAKMQPGLVITVDCGIRACAAAEILASSGIPLIITDHHEPGKELPGAAAVINPKKPGCTYPFKDLAGVGIALKLAWAVAERVSGGKPAAIRPELKRFLRRSLGLAAVGTIADVVPLLGENRVIVRFGLEALSEDTSEGLRALMDASGVSYPVSGDAVAFKIGPRLNAAGRVGSPNDALSLLLCEQSSRAAGIARALDEANEKRKRVQEVVVSQAVEKLGREEYELPAIVLADKRWEPGVTGPAASRLCDRFGCPVVLVAINEDGIGRGSMRSVPGVPAHRILEECGKELITFGGHEGAGGLTLEASRVSAFRNAFLRAVGARGVGESEGAVLHLDAEVPLPALTRSVVDDIERLQPFGSGNPRPVLASSQLEIYGVRRIGDGRHVSFSVSRGRKGSVRAVAFNFGHRFEEIAGMSSGRIDVAYAPQLNSWRGRNSVEMMVVDIRRSDTS